MRVWIFSIVSVFSAVSFSFDSAELLGNWNYTGLSCNSGAKPKKDFPAVMSLRFEAKSALYVSTFPGQNPRCTFVMGPTGYSISGSQLKWQTTYPYFFNICEDGRSKYGNVVAEPFWGIEIQGDLMKIDMGEFTFHGEYCESGDQVYFNFKRNLLPINY